MRLESHYDYYKTDGWYDHSGMLVYRNDAGETVTEKVSVGCAHYERIYDSLINAIENGGEKCVKDEEGITVLEILEEATEAVKSWKK